MALTKITLRNFKSIGEEAQTIELAPYTLLFGPNSAGKSTVIQALVFVNELLSKGARDVYKTQLGGEAIDLGGFLNIVHKKDPERDISITLECSASKFPLTDWTEPGLKWRANVPWPHFFDGPRLRGTGEPHTASIRLVIGRASLSDPRIIVKQFLSGFNGVWLANIEATAAGKQVAVVCEEVRELYDLYDGTELDIPEGNDWEFERSDWEPAELSDVEIYGPGSAEWSHAEESFIPWVLAQQDALPGTKAYYEDTFELTFDVDDLDKYYLEEEWFDGKGLNELRLVEAVTVLPLEIVNSNTRDFLYIGPLRDIPDRLTTQGDARASRGWWNGSAAWEFGSGDHFLPGSSGAKMNEWLGNACLRTGYQLGVKTVSEVPENHPIWRLTSEDLEDGKFETLVNELRLEPSRTRIFLEEEASGLELTAKDVGAGISQIFPVVAAAATQWFSQIFIEQPELHVHPALQTSLADVFIESHFKNHNRFLLETHSEHLVLRFLRRIEETHSNPDSKYFDGDRLTGNVTDESGREMYIEGVPTGEGKHPAVTSQDLAIYYVEPSSAGAIFHKIEISPDGDMAPWPNGFFTEREEELFG